MATLDELQQGLIKADAAGNAADAKAFADAIRSMRTAAPAAAEIPVYSNEGRSGRESIVAPRTTIEKVGDAIDDNPAISTAKFVGKHLGSDAIIGGLKAGGEATKQMLRAFPLTRVATMGGNKVLDEGSAQIDSDYERAGMGAAAGKLVTDAGLLGVPNAVGRAIGSKVAKEGAGVLKRTLGRTLEGATAGGTGAALLTPGEGETRAGNAAQGAAFGGVAGPVLGGIGDLALAGKKYLSTGADAALTRANEMFDKVLGKGVKDSVTANLDLPRNLPMSTAAAAGRQELDALERISRGTANPRNNARWGRLDAQTNTAGLNKLNDAVGDDIAQLQPRAAEKADILPETQNFLNKTKFKDADRQALSERLVQLKDLPAFENNRAAQIYINNLAGDMLAPGNRTLGGLAHLETDLAANASLSPPAKAAIWSAIRDTIDTHSGGAWSAAYGIREAADQGLKQATSANNILGDFQSAYGGARGKVAPSGEAAIGSKRLEAAVNKFGETKPDAAGNAEDLMNPDTRHEVNNLIEALRKAEGPRSGKGGSVSDSTAWGKVALDRGGNPIPGVNSGMVNAARIVLRKITGDRTGSTARAADTALRSPAGWQKMLSAAEKSKEISASDAAMLARILRGSYGAEAAAVTGE